MSQDGSTLNTAEFIRESINIPGMVHLLKTADTVLVWEILFLTAQYVYPPQLMEVFVFWYNAQTPGKKITYLAVDDVHDPDEKEEEELKTPAASGHPPQKSSTAGLELQIIESSSDSSSEEQKSGQVEIEIGVAKIE